MKKEELTLKIIKERMGGVYCRNFPSYSVVKVWSKRFFMGQEDVGLGGDNGRQSGLCERVGTKRRSKKW